MSLRFAAVLAFCCCILLGCSLTRQAQNSRIAAPPTVLLNQVDISAIIATLDTLMATYQYEKTGKDSALQYARMVTAPPSPSGDNRETLLEESIAVQISAAGEQLRVTAIPEINRESTDQAISDKDEYALILHALDGNMREILRILKYQLEFSTMGRIGIAVNGEGTIVRVREEGTAAGAGIRVGDTLFAIDGRRVESFGSLFDIVSKISGPPGTMVTLIVERDGEKKSFTVERVLAD